ncbi:MAG: SRPBCC family protein [Blastocatellia bacterium]
MADERTLIIERVFDAPPDVVFEAWTKPEHLTHWWGPNEFTLPFCEIDFRVTGKYRFCMRSPDDIDYWVWGEYREIVRPERIVMTWNREDAEGNLWSRTVAQLTFAEHDGKTAFKLHQATFESVEYRDQHNGGWTQCLDRLGVYVAAMNIH